MAAAIYFDGLSSKPISVNIIFKEYTFKIFDVKYLNLIATYKYEDIQRSQNLRSGKYTYYLGPENPCPLIQLNSDEFEKELKIKYPESPILKDLNKKILGISGTSALAFLGGFLGLVLLFYFLVYPSIIDYGVRNMPKSFEKKLGQSTYDKYMLSFAMDSATTPLINEFYQKLNVDTSNHIDITCVNSPIKNAFALPGGKMVIFSEIIKNMNSADELIALIGHESGHINLQHSTKALMRALVNYGLFSILLGDYSGVMASAGSIANDMDRLKYSRNLESEADDYGYEFIKNNKKDPSAMVKLFQQLQDDEVGVHVDKIPSFLSSHPAIMERIIETKNKIKIDNFEVEQDAELSALFNRIKSSINALKPDADIEKVEDNCEDIVD